MIVYLYTVGFGGQAHVRMDFKKFKYFLKIIHEGFGYKRGQYHGTFAAGNFGTEKNSTSLIDKTYIDVIIFLVLVRLSFSTFFFSSKTEMYTSWNILDS